MSRGEGTPPEGSEAVASPGDGAPGPDSAMGRGVALEGKESSLAAGDPGDTLRDEYEPEPHIVVSEVALGGPIPRTDPPEPKVLPSGHLYVRLEGRIYGPFTPESMEEILQSGTLTGFEVASPDLHRWTPLAYHPRIIRARVRNFDLAHQALTEMSALPARRSDGQPVTADLPKAAIMRRPKRRNGEDDLEEGAE